MIALLLQQVPNGDTSGSFTMFLFIAGVLAALVLYVILRQVRKTREENEEISEPAVAPVAVTETTGQEGLDDLTLVLITAAAMAVVGGPVQVKKITFLNQNTISAWAEVGRISIQSSHNVRRSL